MKPVVLELSGESISVATGNLILKRKNLVIDTQLGQLAAGLVYNSADNVWRFSFDMTHDGQFFTDQTGTWYDLAPVTTGFEVTGSHWVAHGPNAVRTRGGLIHEFEGGVLERSYWNHFEYPRISYHSEQIANKRRVMRIEQCFYEDSLCRAVFEIARDALGRVTRIEDRAGRAAEFFYDTNGNLIAARDALDIEEGWSGARYDYAPGPYGIERLAARTTSEGERSEYGYDAKGHLTMVRRKGEGDPTYRFEYSRIAAESYQTVVTKPGGGSRVYRYDPFWRLSEFENEEGETTHYGWSGFEPSSQTDDAGTTTRWSYGRHAASFPGDRQVIIETKPSGNIVTSVFSTTDLNISDPLEYALVSKEDSMGVIETREYELGRLHRTRNGSGESTTFLYESGLFPSEITDASNRKLLIDHYGENGNPSGVGLWLNGMEVYDAPRLYDAVGNLLQGSSIETPLSPGTAGNRFQEF